MQMKPEPFTAQERGLVQRVCFGCPWTSIHAQNNGPISPNGESRQYGGVQYLVYFGGPGPTLSPKDCDQEPKMSQASADVGHKSCDPEGPHTLVSRHGG